MSTNITIYSTHKDEKNNLAKHYNKLLCVACISETTYISLAGKFRTDVDESVFELKKDDAIRIAKSIISFYSQD